jgi:L-serine/L-threonine ammonia-lyase
VTSYPNENGLNYILSRVLLKLENLQPSGSFKSRGVGNFILSYLRSHASRNPTPHFYSSSGGNAGLACVVAATSLGHPATVVVPLSTKPLMIAKIRAGGAKDVVQHGASWREADTYLREVLLVQDPSGVYVPPFDAVDIWEGNSTIIDEVDCQLREEVLLSATQQPKPSAVICSVGGGGLFCGIMRGLDRLGWTDVSVVAVETAGAESLAASLKAGELVTLQGITSQATSLGATRVAEQTFEYAMKRPKQVRSVVVDDSDAARACCWCADEERMVVELACGASVAICAREKIEAALRREIRKEDVIVVVLCGGSNVTVEMLESWRKEHHVKPVIVST